MTSNGNYAILHLACGRGGTGRRVRLRGVWETVWVQVPSTAPTEKTILLSSFFHFLSKMLRRCRSVGAYVRCARATQMQALDYPSLAVDRTKKMTCTFIVQVFFFCKGVRDLNGTLRKQHSALFLVPGVSTALAAQKKAYETPAPVGLRSKSHRPHQQKRRYCYRLFFSFYRVLSFLFFDIMFYFVLLSSTFHGINSYISFKFLLQKCLECVLPHL